jgi:cyclic nucleotide-binding protein/PilZ domain-containing protein
MSDKLEARVTPEQDPAERRKWPRKRSLLQATLVTVDGSFDCRVLDFSPGGAKVEFAHPLAKKQNVTLILRPIGTFAGVVAWCGSGCFGMQFLGQTSRAGAAPADIAAAVSALKAPADIAAAASSPKAPAQLATHLLADQGSRFSAQPDALPVAPPSATDSAPSSTDAAPVPDDETPSDDARSLAAFTDTAPAQQRPLEILKRLRQEEKVFTLQPGDVLFREADPAGRIYIVGSGLLKVQNGADEAIGGGDGVLGELGLARKHRPLSPSAHALTECEVVEIDARRFMELIEEQPVFAAMVMQVISRLFRNMGELGQWTNPGNSKTEPSRPSGTDLVADSRHFLGEVFLKAETASSFCR